jgi:hypothetical protein
MISEKYGHERKCKTEKILLFFLQLGRKISHESTAILQQGWP